MPEQVAWFVYLVRCADGTLYTGTAKNVADRVLKHNTGQGAKYTRVRRPVTLVYAEPHPNRSVACQREAQLKKLSREAKLQLVLQ